VNSPKAPAGVADAAAVQRIEHPDPALMTYYTLACLLTGPLFPILIIPQYFRYHTMRYRFDGDGISMRWGILFRREVQLTYARIQDIHLTSNLIERWLGLARIQVQTASGSSAAELTIEGIKEYEVVRDFIYSKMRGHAARLEAPAFPTAPAGDLLAEVAASMREVSQELRALRRELGRRNDRDV
jgi:putative membrane protein